jgi:hypothetical protein
VRGGCSITPESHDGQTDPDLFTVVGTWPTLPEATRAGIVAVIRGKKGKAVKPTAPDKAVRTKKAQPSAAGVPGGLRNVDARLPFQPEYLAHPLHWSLQNRVSSAFPDQRAV